MKNKIVLQGVSEAGNGASMHLDTLGVSVNEQDIANYLDEKKKILGELEAQDDKIFLASPEEYLLEFEQILAHESFHVYQALCCRALEEHSDNRRSEQMAMLNGLTQFLMTGQKVIQSETPILDICNSSNEESFKEYWDFLKKEGANSELKLDEKCLDADLSLREIIEGGAVAFQHISQFDVLGKKIDLRGSVYTNAWDRFCRECEIEDLDIEGLTFVKLLFLFSTDVFLKSYGSKIKSANEFLDTIYLVKPLLSKLPEYKADYLDAAKRDKTFLDSLSHVERDETLKEKIIDYLGCLSKQSQCSLYINIRLYSDVFKATALAGTAGKKRYYSKKHEAINHYLHEKFPYWGSNFSIPCILADYPTCMSFTLMWTDFSGVKFVNEVSCKLMTVSEDNSYIELLNKLESASSDENKSFRCCFEHAEVKLAAARRCLNDDSVNMQCKNLFGKYLGEIVTNE